MSYQRTIKKQIEEFGIDLYGGHEIKLEISPAPPNTGLVFRTKKGDIDSKLKNAYVYKSAIMLDNGKGARALHVEHLLATLFFYEIDNAIIGLERTSDWFKARQKYHLATQIDVVPEFPKMQNTICDAIDQAGVEEQDEIIKKIHIGGKIIAEETDPNFKLPCILEFHNTHEGYVSVEANIEYDIIGSQSAKIIRNADEYKGIASARRYAKHFVLPEWIMRLAVFFYSPGFGLGHGFTRENCFIPVSTHEEWLAQEKINSEIAAHGIIDRAGTLCLLEQSLEGRMEGIDIISHFSGHKSDLRFLKENIDKFLVE